jgi:adenine-specific DNA-methyltransferase
MKKESLIATSFRRKKVEEFKRPFFREKQTIIENCLFGVDINPKSVMICRLRLWIELLKNAYYTESSKYKELETLPNIDINIKCGNSLISRFEVKDSVFESIPNFQTRLKEYTTWVQVYKGERDKSAKAQLVKKIDQFKSEFKLRDKRTDKVQNEMDKVTMEILKSKNPMFPLTDIEKAKVKDYEAKLEKLTQEKKDIESNPIYQNAFEWRFEFPEVLDNKGGFIGFDVVIGNPPYVSLVYFKDINHFKTQYKTYNATGDLYCLFYELSFNITKQNCFVNLITSNKWMRSTYGDKLREFFLTQTNPLSLIDFSWYQIFESASVDTNIFVFQKSNNENECKATIANSDFTLEDLDRYIFKNQINFKISNSEYWNIVEENQNDLKLKIESKGIKLKDWKLNINRGVLTGFNEAYIINKELNDELILKDNNSKEVIESLLVGRDIERFGYSFRDNYLINIHNGLKSEKINPIDINDFPIIKEHLDKYKDKLQKRLDKGLTVYNLRNCAYLNEFKKDKLVWAETMRVHKSDLGNFPRFGYDDTGKFLDKTTFFATGDNIKFVLGVLNSQLGKWLIKEYISKLDTGGYMVQKVSLENIPVIQSNEKDTMKLEKLVDQILSLKKSNPEADTSSLEAEIDMLVYELYGLSEEEIKVVEGK